MQQCQRSCNACPEPTAAPKSLAPVTASLTAAPRPVTDAPRLATSYSPQRDCIDSAPECAAWALAGYCGKYAAYMAGSCTLSCGKCGSTTEAVVPMTQLPTTWTAIHGMVANKTGADFGLFNRNCGEPIVLASAEADIASASPYPDDAVCYWLISPQPLPSSIVLTVSSLELETEYDVLRVYDGRTELATRLLGAFSGSATPTAVEARTGSMLLVFRSDYSLQAAGFRMRYRSSAILLPQRMGGGCIDVESRMLCEYWSSFDHCTAPIFSAYMRANCDKTCFDCEPSLTTHELESPAAPTAPMARPPMPPNANRETLLNWFRPSAFTENEAAVAASAASLAPLADRGIPWAQTAWVATASAAAVALLLGLIALVRVSRRRKRAARRVSIASSSVRPPLPIAWGEQFSHNSQAADGLSAAD